MAADESGAARDAELARYFDLDLAEYVEDIELYLALASGSPLDILELACGSGRVAVPLARAGHRVIGVDRDAQMLERARATWSAVPPGEGSGSLDLIEADITALDLGRRFELVILGLNTLHEVGPREAQLATLQALARHVAPGGRGVVDVWLPRPEDLAAYDGRLELAWLRPDPDDGSMVAKLWTADYDAATQVATLTAFFDAWPPAGGTMRRTSRSDRLHLLGASELLALAEAAGLRPAQLGGDYSMSPFGPGSERAVLVCSLL